MEESSDYDWPIKKGLTARRSGFADIKFDWRKLLAEPLVQFLLAGLAIFAISLATGAGNSTDRTIIVDEPLAGRLAESFTQTWRRPPSPQELDTLIRDYVREEIYYREAKRLGLDIDDAVIRRRLRSKMEFLAEAQVEAVEPSRQELEQWFEQNKSRYAVTVRYSFDQIFVDVSRPGDPDQRAQAILNSLAAGDDWQLLGDPISLPASIEGRDASQVTREFGEGFSGKLDQLKTGAWQGPINSGFGLHVVRLRQRDAGPAPTLDTILRQVTNDWRSETIKKRQDEAFNRLLEQYDVKIEVE